MITQLIRETQTNKVMQGQLLNKHKKDRTATISTQKKKYLK